MSNLPIQKLLDCAMRTAHTAGLHAKEQFARRREVNENLEHDIKLVLDRECQTVAEACVAEDFPDHAILGEEGSIEKESDYKWVIDPIDGTMNFFHGLHHWCSSVAVMHLDKLVAGAVYLPDTDEMFSAAEGLPALLNGNPISISPCDDLGEALVLVGLGKPLPNQAHNIAPFQRLTHHAQKTRIQGAAAIDLCLVACGRAEAYVDNRIQLWDFAAAQIIVQQAGGTFDILQQFKDGGTQVICSNGHLHDAVKSIYLDEA
jgi:myo-inositol-1(or 4)-monophosphatase